MFLPNFACPRETDWLYYKTDIHFWNIALETDMEKKLSYIKKTLYMYLIPRDMLRFFAYVSEGPLRQILMGLFCLEWAFNITGAVQHREHKNNLIQTQMKKMEKFQILSHKQHSDIV